MNVKVKKIIFRELGILSVFTLVVSLSDLIYYISYVGMDRLSSFLGDEVSFMQLIPVLTFFYPIYILIRIVRRKYQNPRRMFILIGSIAIISGISSFLWAGLMYIFANMDYVGFSHILVIFLSPVLTLIGVIYIVIGIIKVIRNQDVPKG